MSLNKLENSKSDSNKRSDQQYRGSLRKTLLILFLVLSLVPLVLVSIISYNSAYQSLYNQEQKLLSAVSNGKAALINEYFSQIFIELQDQSQSEYNAKFLMELTQAFKQSGISISDFVKSYRWATITEEKGDELKTCLRTYGLHDILMLDINGNILYTIKQEGDLGTNVYEGKGSTTLFAKTCRQSFETGEKKYSDLEHYWASNNKVSGFVVDVVLDDLGDKIGLIAFQIPLERLETITNNRENLGNTGESYLIGTDLRMRSNLSLNKEKNILNNSIQTEQSQHWFKIHVENAQPECDHYPSIYKGINGQSVFGVHENLNIAGVLMALITEIDEEEVFEKVNTLRIVMIFLFTITAAFVFLLAYNISKRLVTPIKELTNWSLKIAAGDFSFRSIKTPNNEIGILNESYISAVKFLQKAATESEKNDWLKTGIASLNEVLRGEKEITALCNSVISFLAQYLNAQVGTISIADNKNNHLNLVGSYAYKKRKKTDTVIKFGEGLVGQAAQDKNYILVTDIPEDFIPVTSALGEAKPHNILCYPFIYEKQVKGVIELGSLDEFTDVQLNFMSQVSESIAIAVQSAQLREQTKLLLDESQTQAEELQSQQEELRTTNEELEQKSNELEKVAANLETQRTELEEALNAEQKQLRSLFDGINDVIYVADPDSYELLFVNEVFRKFWGDDVLGKKCYNVLQERDEPCPFCSNDKIFGEHEGETYVWEFQNEVTKDWYRCADKAIKWPDGRSVRFEIASNITPIKKSQEQLQVLANRYTTLMENIPQKIFLKDKESVYISMNENFARDLNVSLEDVPGKTDYDFFPKELADKYREDDKRLMDAGKIEELEEKYIQDGQEMWVRTIKVPMKKENGEVHGILGIFWDITDQKVMESKLQEYERSENEVKENIKRVGGKKNVK